MRSIPGMITAKERKLFDGGSVNTLVRYKVHTDASARGVYNISAQSLFGKGQCCQDSLTSHMWMHLKNLLYRFARCQFLEEVEHSQYRAPQTVTEMMEIEK
jgi:hypothetical protein